jgi:hypothetical protein
MRPKRRRRRAVAHEQRQKKRMKKTMIPAVAAQRPQLSQVEL